MALPEILVSTIGSLFVTGYMPFMKSHLDCSDIDTNTEVSVSEIHKCTFLYYCQIDCCCHYAKVTQFRRSFVKVFISVTSLEDLSFGGYSAVTMEVIGIMQV